MQIHYIRFPMTPITDIHLLGQTKACAINSEHRSCDDTI